MHIPVLAEVAVAVEVVEVVVVAVEVVEVVVVAVVEEEGCAALASQTHFANGSPVQPSLHLQSYPPRRSCKEIFAFLSLLSSLPGRLHFLHRDLQDIDFGQAGTQPLGFQDNLEGKNTPSCAWCSCTERWSHKR